MLATPQTGWRLIAPATDEVLTLDQARAHLKVDFPNDDALIQIFIDTAVEFVQSRNVLLAPQTWEMVLDHFPCWGEVIMLWKNPVQSVDFINYVDENGATQTWNDYHLAKSGRLARIAPAYGS